MGLAEEAMVYELQKIGNLLHKIVMKQEEIAALISHSTKSHYNRISGEVEKENK